MLRGCNRLVDFGLWVAVGYLLNGVGGLGWRG